MNVLDVDDYSVANGTAVAWIKIVNTLTNNFQVLSTLCAAKTKTITIIMYCYYEVAATNIILLFNIYIVSVHCSMARITHYAHCTGRRFGLR